MDSDQTGGLKGLTATLAKKAEEKTKQLVSSMKGSKQASQQRQVYMAAPQPYNNAYQTQYGPQGTMQQVMIPIGPVPSNMVYPMMGQQPIQSTGYLQSTTGRPTMAYTPGHMTQFQQHAVSPQPTTGFVTGRPMMTQSAVSGQSMGGRPTMQTMSPPPMVIPMRPLNSPLTMPARPVASVPVQPMTQYVQRPKLVQQSSNAAPVSQPFTMDQYTQMMDAFMKGNQEQKTRPVVQKPSNEAEEEEETNPEEETPDAGTEDAETKTEGEVIDLTSTEHTLQSQETPTAYFQMQTMMDPMQGYASTQATYFQEASGLEAQMNVMMGMQMQQQSFENAFGYPQGMDGQQNLFGGMMQQEVMQTQFQMPTECVPSVGIMDFGNVMNTDCFGQTMDPGVFGMGGYDTSMGSFDPCAGGGDASMGGFEG